MSEQQEGKVSRRDFARRAAMLSATVPLSSTAALFGLATPAGAIEQDASNLPNLGPAGQAEADARFQNIVNLHATLFDDQQKQMIKTLCVFLQPALDRVRAYPLDNGDSGALYLKPLVERERKPQPARPTPTSTQHP